MFETAILTIGVLLGVGFLGTFLLLTHMTRNLEGRYVLDASHFRHRLLTRSPLMKRITDWYLTRDALPFWLAFGLDCLIIIYCHLMAAYLLFGVQALVPYFWAYVLFAIYTLPCYYVGMKLLRSYETIMRFSTMEDLARIACAVFVGTMLVTLGKNVVPIDWLPVYPIWEEQLVMMLCAVVLMWFVRIMVKATYDSSSRSRNRNRVLIYGTSVPSIETGLALRNDETSKSELVAFVRADEKEPHLTIKGVDLMNPKENIAERMQALHVETLIVSLTAYPDFFTTRKSLVDELLEKELQVMAVGEAVN